MSYGYLLWGHSGAVQLDLRGGAGLTYVSEGQRVGIGPEVSLTLRGGHLYLSGAARLQGSVGVSGSGLERPGLDTVLRLDAGAQIGALLIALAGCAGTLGRHQEANVEPTAVCRLIQGDVRAWAGLGTLDHARLPPCLGPVIRKGTLRVATGTLATDLRRPAAALGEVRVAWWMNGRRVAFDEVAPSSGLDPGPLQSALGNPDATFRYGEEERAYWDLAEPAGGTLEEVVYGTRGVALLVSHDAGGAATVVRLRGFASMPAARYLDDYVRLRPEPP